MFVSVRIYNSLQQTEEVVRRGRAGLVPMLQAQPGFRSYGFVACEDGSARSVSCFEDEAQSDGAYERTRDWVSANLADLVPNPPTILKGEITQDQAVPKHVADDAYVTFQSARGVAPRAQAVQPAREKIVDEILKDPAMAGFYSFRDTADESHMISVAFFRSAADAKRVHARIWEMMQERLPHIYPNKPEVVGGTMILAAM